MTIDLHHVFFRIRSSCSKKGDQYLIDDLSLIIYVGVDDGVGFDLLHIGDLPDDVKRLVTGHPDEEIAPSFKAVEIAQIVSFNIHYHSIRKTENLIIIIQVPRFFYHTYQKGTDIMKDIT